MGFFIGKEWLRNWDIRTVEKSDSSGKTPADVAQTLSESEGAIKFCPQCANELVIAEVDGKPRQECPSEFCNYVFWNNPTPVVGAITELNGDVILVRNKQWPKKIFGLVTGFLEKGETPEAGVLREVKEELGLEAKIVDFVGYYSFFQMNQLILVFHLKAEGEIVMGEELAEIKPVHPKKLRPWRFGTGYAVEDWLKTWKPTGASKED
jgi:NAD+ diphosphatase